MDDGAPFQLVTFLPSGVFVFFEICHSTLSGSENPSPFLILTLLWGPWIEVSVRRTLFRKYIPYLSFPVLSGTPLVAIMRG